MDDSFVKDQDVTRRNGDEFALGVELFVLRLWNLVESRAVGGLLRARDARKVLRLEIEIDPTTQDQALSWRRLIAMPRLSRWFSVGWTPNESIGYEFQVFVRRVDGGFEDLVTMRSDETYRWKVKRGSS